MQQRPLSGSPASTEAVKNALECERKTSKAVPSPRPSGKATNFVEASRSYYLELSAKLHKRDALHLPAARGCCCFRKAHVKGEDEVALLTTLAAVPRFTRPRPVKIP